MTKSNEEVISEFNINTNMSVGELENWLDNPKSKEAGTGVGIESGHKIVEILKKNPEKDPEKYDEEDITHMRKVVNYDKRHLAQEDKLKDTKTREELEETKSTKSLRNWGHDPIKTLDDDAEGEEDTEPEVSPQQESEKPSKQVAEGGTKRKLDDEDEKEGEASGASEGEADRVDDNEDEADGRARKKSKTTSEEVQEEVEVVEVNTCSALSS
ncbi:hypothetical protein BXZ70DRAFT_353789 [Cristinia sonorae]|uniref:Uncharacterized protein n=1 Tax=Cristinia sonorae TaxID=1940300 RepID=A0A8K0UJH7_9AGAR|nr:hypothetical protein BXZ70DRAFT_353789 [Cristinia sonorae]